MAITTTPLLGLPYAGADTDETYAVLGRLFVKDGQKLTLPEIVDNYTPTIGTVYIKAADWTAADGTTDAYDAKITISGVEPNSMILIYPATDSDAEKAKRLGIRAKAASGVANDDTFVIVRATGGDPTVTEGINLVYIAMRGFPDWSAGVTPPALPYATVIGVAPYIATEEGDRDDIAASQRLVTEAFAELRISLSTLFTGLADTNTALELRLKTADLPTKLDDYRTAKGLIDKTVSDLVNYYTKSQTLTKDEINALVSAIPKFEIEVVTSLPTSNISDTTVYLVKSGDDDTNLYTEYIRTGDKWEKLGTQTVDLTGYATEAWVNDILAAYVKTVDMEAYLAEVLAGYLTKEDAAKTYQTKGDYLTQSDLPTIPDKLPNPYALTINGQTYNGSSPVEVTVEGGASVDIMYIAPDGDDANDGLTVDTPKATVKACFMAGASRISAKRGVYRQAVDISPTGGVGDVAGRTIEIFPTDNEQTYSTDTHDRGRIVFDTSDEIAVSAFGEYNSIKSAPYSVSNYTFTRVFVNGATDGRATVWLVSADERTVCRMLTPVTTLAEVESTTNTFYWANGTLYVNSDWEGVEKVFVSNEMYNQMQFKGLASVILREVEARLSQGYCVNIENVPHFELYECVAKFTGVKSTGLHPKNASGKMVKCYATRCYDGLSPSGYGHTVYLDCVAEYNRDDGLSHHNACAGTIIGGRYSYNGKYGIDPAYGAKVDIYNVLCEGNGYDYNGGGIGYLYAADLIPASGIVQGAVLVGNKVGLSVGNSCSVVASNCVFADNDTDKSIHASANYSEYNITDGLVKSVNGVKPDSNGNVTIEVSGDAPVVDTNLLHSAINSDGSKYGDTNGDNTDGYGNGYRVGYRVSSSGVEKESSVNCCTGFIACQPNEVLTMENFTNESAGYSVIYFFDSSFAKTTGNMSVGSCMADGVATITIPSTSNIAYMRITTGVITDDTVITKVSA